MTDRFSTVLLRQLNSGILPYLLILTHIGLGSILVAVLNWSAFADALVIDTPAGIRRPDADLVLGILLGLYGIVLLLGLGLAVFVYLGRNWARPRRVGPRIDAQDLGLGDLHGAAVARAGLCAIRRVAT